MAESKRTFQSGLMNKDSDDRVVPAGQYRDALNVSVEFSEDGNVGALENLKGNEVLGGSAESYLDPANNIGITVIGTCVDEENDKIYYLFTGSTTDGIVEYCNQTNTLSPILLDGDVGVVEVAVPTFTFADANAAATVDQGGNVFVQAEFGVITSLTNSFNTYVTVATPRQISAKVKVPGGYTNSNSFVEGTLTATQPSLGLPDVYIEPITNLTDTTVTFNARFASNPNLTAIGFKYLVNSGGTQTVDIYSNSFVAGTNEIYGNTISMYNPSTRQVYLEGVPASDFDVLDSTNTVISSSNYDVTTFESGRPTNVTFNDDYNINDNTNYNIVQTSSLSTINNAISESDLQSTGTNISVTPISSPFKTDVTGLTPDTNYVLLAYATNSSGTTYSNVINFKTNVASISLPTFTNSTASAGTSLVVIGATPQLNGGDAGATLYVVSSQGSNTSVSDYKTSAYTLIAGGSASGFELHTIGSWSSGVAQSVSIATTGGSIRRGLVFAKNSSSLQNGSDTAGYTFDTALVSATANSPNVNGAASFSGSMSGPTGTKSAGQTLTWSVNGTSTVTVVPSGGHTVMHSDVFKTAGAGSAWHPGAGWINLGSGNTAVGDTQSWNYSETTTAPTTPGTYSWQIRVYYDSNTQSGGLVTGSFTIPAAVATSGTFTLAGNLIIGTSVGQAYGGGSGTGLLFNGAVPSGISVGSLVTITGGGATNVIQVTSMTSGSSSFIGYTLYSGSGGVFYSQGNTVNWSV